MMDAKITGNFPARLALTGQLDDPGIALGRA